MTTTNTFDFENMTLSELADMARYYSNYSDDSISRMEKNKSRSTLVAAIKYSSKFMTENRTGKFTFDSNANKASTSVEMDDTLRVQKAQEDRIRSAEKFVDDICRRWASAYGLEEEYDRRTK